jgi:photosystem II stability/assembly factor-like uncharacterized protein
MGKRHFSSYWLAIMLALTGAARPLAMPSAVRAGPPASAPASWTHAGWGGGGFYWAAAFHPTRDWAIYLAGDVGGVYKSVDRGANWTVINNGLVDYGVYSLAVDRKSPETVYAATEGGLCKSTDGGGHWQLLPRTGRTELRITGEKGKSIRCIAVDPADGNIVYAGSPGGKVYKSADGGRTWAVSYEKKARQDAKEQEALRVQFGKVSGDWHGGFWMPLALPKDVKAEECSGLGFSFKAEGARPRDVFVTLKTAAGVSYRSRNLSELFQPGAWRDVVLGKDDFAVDPEYAKKNPEQAKAQPAPQWATVNRVDFVCVGSLPQEASVGWFGKFFFAFAPAGAAAGKPALVTVRDFAKDKKVWAYGNVRTGQSEGGAVYSVAIAPGEPSLVLAATDDSGLLISTDAGATWRATETPRKASSAAVAAGDASIIYAAFHTDGVWKSADKGRTWKHLTQGLPKEMSITEVAVGPAGTRDVYAIGTVGWGGAFYRSADGGETWAASSTLAPDAQNDPTLPQEPKPAPLSVPTNLAVNPGNPKELFISANWRSCMSEDGGATWSERMKGADISCIYDIRFSGPRTYAAAMDEGTLVSEDNGLSWKPLWPLKWNPQISGHNWRLVITPQPSGGDRIVATCSPWEPKYANCVILSPDGGKTFKIATDGLPAYIPRSNTMWGQGYARALAVDPGDPQVLYMGIDGDPSEGNAGGGVFKSADGGGTWKPLPSQPGSRRMFFGLAVDPTDSKRLYWAACGDRGGLYRSENGGESWELVFKDEQWCFNVMVTADGTVYCPGKNLWRSGDHGKTWARLTKFTGERVIVAMESHPRDPKTMWFTATTWDGSADGGVYKTADGGATWQEITGDLPYRKPMVLRFNPQTNELWAGGVGLYHANQ